MRIASRTSQDSFSGLLLKAPVCVSRRVRSAFSVAPMEVSGRGWFGPRNSVTRRAISRAVEGVAGLDCAPSAAACADRGASEGGDGRHG